MGVGFVLLWTKKWDSYNALFGVLEVSLNLNPGKPPPVRTERLRN